MKKNNELCVSLSTTKIDKNQKGIWAKISYRETTTTIPQFINALGEGYAFAHLFVHNGDTFNYKERLNCNYKGSQVVAIDIDHTTISFEKFNDIMTSTEIKPSITYTTQNNNIKGYRYRALYVVDELMSGDIYKEIYAHLTNEIVCYFVNGTIEIDNNANKLNQQFCGNGTENFEYKEGNVFCLKWLCERYEINNHNNLNAEVEKVRDGYIINNDNKVSHRYIYSTNEKPQGGYIISKVNDSSSNTNNHCNLNDINVHSNYIEYLLKKKLENEKPQGGYIIKKEEEHYITMWRFLEQIESNEFINDYYHLSVNDIIEKYISVYPSIEFSKVEYDKTQPYYLLPQDYLEIKRKWHYREIEKENGDTYRVTEIERCKNGQGRRRRLFINLIIRRLITPTITFEHLLFNALYELNRFIDNNDKDDIITKKDVAEITINAHFEDLDKWSKLKRYHKLKFKVNKDYCVTHNLNARRLALKINAEQNKQARQERDAEIAKYYNAQLKEKENLNLLEENGVVISLRALQRWKKENGYTKSKREKQNTSANKAIERENNKKVEQQPSTTITSRESANNKQIKMKRESEQSNIKVMLDGSERELRLSEIRSELFCGKTLTLTNNIIAIRAFNLNDDLSYTMAVSESEITPSFVTTNKKDDVICYYVLDNAVNENDYNTISNQICEELRGFINVQANECITPLVNGYEFERGEKFGCISNSIIYNSQWLISRYNAQ